ncbi:signal recognition particle-docking protein FtsY [Saccharolobus sp. E5-1-F]|uniref:signal recognition particle-docking protein FtsY n=1 Tax=Saccharolobus sp. E5-1-F TaxID=2663019 RepID=UPI001EE7D2AA|nr:signal recognition particle-docking protein FtsY [Sulfolobus sp. E5-1-F]
MNNTQQQTSHNVTYQSPTSEVKEKDREEEKKSGGSIFDVFRYKEIKEKDIEDLIEELRYQLLESDVSFEVTEKILEDLKENLVGKKVKRSEDLEKIVKDSLKKSITEIITKNKPVNILEEIKKSPKPYIIIFFGINGVGKTTTIAKFAFMLKKNSLSCIISASDTFRAAAQEQLEIHARNLEIPLVKGKYGSDPASVAFDAIRAAKSRGIDVVLIDTAGRMHTDTDLVNELKRIVNITRPNLKILVLDSLGGNDALEQAKYFENNVGFDLVILTKVDADVKGGVILSLAYELNKPVGYLGVGQTYDDLIPFNAEWFIQRLFS